MRHSRSRWFACVPVLLFTTLFPVTASADWGYRGVAVAPSLETQLKENIVSDGAGGAIVFFSDFSSALYAQRIDEHGNPMWGAGGVVVAMTSPLPRALAISDGAGGAIVMWTDNLNEPNGDVLAQRLDSNGSKLWGPNGVPVATGADTQYGSSITDDGAGGAIIALQVYDGSYAQIYVVRVTSAGAVPWTANGVALYPAAWDQYIAQLSSDGAGGAYVVWEHQQYGPTDIDMRARTIDAAGTPGNVYNVCSSTGNQERPLIVSDDAGGAIVAWEDERNSGSTLIDVYAQRLQPGGSIVWTPNGRVVAASTGDDNEVSMAADGFGGAIIAWREHVVDNGDIIARRLGPTGASEWLLPICADDGTVQQRPIVVPDGQGGATILCLFDDALRTIYGNRVDAFGAVGLWGSIGKEVTGAFTNSASGFPATRASSGDVFVLWQDTSIPGEQQVRAQRLEALTGDWGHPEAAVTSVNDTPYDQGGHATVNWLAGGYDRNIPNIDIVTYYSVWRATDAVTAKATLAAAAGVDVVADVALVGPDFDGVAIRHEQTAAGDFYWEWVGNQPAVYASAYSFVAATRADSIDGDPATHYFQVVSHTADPYVVWTSDPADGHSIDNLAPAPPLNLTAQQVGNYVLLYWESGGVLEPDFKEYAVYRSTANGVPIGPTFFLSSTDDTTLTDTGISPGQPYYYVVTAVDIHGNNSLPSNEAGVNPTITGVGDRPPVPPALTLLPNSPNPFGASTDINVGLPRAGDVTLEVYDVAGRRIVERRIAGMAAGWQRIAFDGRDARGVRLPSGVYFYRVRAAGTTVTRKMVVGR